jgi:hypothetical protein
MQQPGCMDLSAAKPGGGTACRIIYVRNLPFNITSEEVSPAAAAAMPLIVLNAGVACDRWQVAPAAAARATTISLIHDRGQHQ